MSKTTTRTRHRTASILAVLSLVFGLCVGTTFTAVPAVAVNTNQFAWPATGHTDANDVAWHRSVENGARAVDIQATTGTDVEAAQSGKVVVASNSCANSGSSGCGGGFGNYVIVRHDRTGVSNPLYTLYAHLNSVLSVSVNASVSTGTKLGDIALSGSTTGAHVHFAIGTCQALWSTGPADYNTNCTVWNGADTTSATVTAGEAVPGTYSGLVALSGGSNDGSAAAVVSSNGDLRVFVVADDGHLWGRRYDAAAQAWAGWNDNGSAGGGLQGSVSAHISNNGDIRVFVTAADNHLWSRRYDVIAQAWAGWNDNGTAGGGFTSTAGSFDEPDGDIRVYVVSENGHAYGRRYDIAAGAWAGWSDVGTAGGGFVSGVGSLTKPNGDIHVFAIAANDHLYGRRYDASAGAWAGWNDNGSAGGGLVSGSGAFLEDDGDLRVYAVSTNGHIWGRRYDTAAQTWAGWNDNGTAGGGLKNGVGTVESLAGDIHVFVTAADGDLWGRRYDASAGAWAGWNNNGSVGGGF